MKNIYVGNLSYDATEDLFVRCSKPMAQSTELASLPIGTPASLAALPLSR